MVKYRVLKDKCFNNGTMNRGFDNLFESFVDARNYILDKLKNAPEECEVSCDRFIDRDVVFKASICYPRGYGEVDYYCYWIIEDEYDEE